MGTLEFYKVRWGWNSHHGISDHPRKRKDTKKWSLLLNPHFDYQDWESLGSLTLDLLSSECWGINILSLFYIIYNVCNSSQSLYLNIFKLIGKRKWKKLKLCVCVYTIFLAYHGLISFLKNNLNVSVLNLFNKVKFSVEMWIDLIAHSRYLIKMIS